MLTEKNKADLTRCAEDILLAREAHFPQPSPSSTIQTPCPPICARPTSATMSAGNASISAAGSRTTPSGWEKLFELYTKMNAGAGPERSER